MTKLQRKDDSIKQKLKQTKRKQTEFHEEAACVDNKAKHPVILLFKQPVIDMINWKHLVTL